MSDWNDFVQNLEPHDRILATLYQKLSCGGAGTEKDIIEFLYINKQETLSTIADHLNIR